MRREPEQEEEGGGAGLRPRSPAGRQGVYYPAARGAGPHLPSSRRVHGARGAGSPVLASHPRLAAAGRCGASAGPGLRSDSHCAARQCVRVTVSADRSRDVTHLSGLSLGQGHRGGPHRWRPASPDSSLPDSPAGCRPEPRDAAHAVPQPRVPARSSSLGRRARSFPAQPQALPGCSFGRCPHPTGPACTPPHVCREGPSPASSLHPGPPRSRRRPPGPGLCPRTAQKHEVVASVAPVTSGSSTNRTAWP